jgi:hypothetical protein
VIGRCRWCRRDYYTTEGAHDEELADDHDSRRCWRCGEPELVAEPAFDVVAHTDIVRDRMATNVNTMAIRAEYMYNMYGWNQPIVDVEIKHGEWPRPRETIIGGRVMIHCKLGACLPFRCTCGCHFCAYLNGTQ